MRTRNRYSFTVLRYVHDVVTGEFANVGVVLYAPEARYLGARCVNTYSRLSAFFGLVDPAHFKKLMLHIEGAVERLSESLFKTPRLDMFGDRLPTDVMACAGEILPPDDSSLQFSQPGGGVADHPEAALARLFDRYVERYAHRPQKPTRNDEQVLGVFRRELKERAILGRLHAKTIVAPSYEHEFPHAWQNGKWNACEAVSFDLAAAGDVAEKANKWLGRGVTLSESKERFKLYLLIGKPSAERLDAAFNKATSILHKMPCEHELVMEDAAPAFAEAVMADLRAHGEAD